MSDTLMKGRGENKSYYDNNSNNQMLKYILKFANIKISIKKNMSN